RTWVTTPWDMDRALKRIFAEFLTGIELHVVHATLPGHPHRPANLSNLWACLMSRLGPEGDAVDLARRSAGACLRCWDLDPARPGMTENAPAGAVCGGRGKGLTAVPPVQPS